MKPSDITVTEDPGANSGAHKVDTKKQQRTGVIILPTQTKHYKEEIPQNLHIFALFDPPQMGNLMIPDETTKERSIEQHNQLSVVGCLAML